MLDHTRNCSFCGVATPRKGDLVVGPGVSICHECVGTARDSIGHAREERRLRRESRRLLHSPEDGANGVPDPNEANRAELERVRKALRDPMPTAEQRMLLYGADVALSWILDKGSPRPASLGTTTDSVLDAIWKTAGRV
jgi:hypothetical protein